MITAALLVGGSAYAAQINTHGDACNALLGSQVTLVTHAGNGTTTGAGAPAMFVMCPVARTPLDAGTVTARFFVDGDNNNGASTTCTIYSYDFTGALLTSSNFTTSAAHYDQLVTMPASLVSTFAYVTAACLLPTNGNGTIRGITAMTN